MKFCITDYDCENHILNLFSSVDESKSNKHLFSEVKELNYFYGKNYKFVKRILI